MWKQFQYGVCYYPEHWDARRHARDIQRIAAAGFGFVRLGEGAWSYFEPREGEFRFALFDRVIDLCRKHGLRVIMGTPTYAAPAWVATTYPQVLRWNFERVPMGHGSRRHLNYTSEKYLELSDRICAALGEHYAGEKQIVAWQLDNEFNCHMDVSYAPSDEVAFAAWLKGRYGSIAALNAAWGTAFWSQTYDDWGQVGLPRPTAAYQNPSALLDESRFISDTVVRFAARQAAILRRYNPKWQITHNGLFGNIDGPALAGTLDFFCHDQYPLFHPEGAWWQYNWGLIQARSLSFPYGILEQQSGPGGQMAYLQRTPRPGQLRLWAWQSIAHGAKLLSYFRWRTCPYGSEQHWHGLIDADDLKTPRLEEAKRLGREIRALPSALWDAPPARRVALLRDYDSETNERRVDTYVGQGAWEAGRWRDAVSLRHLPLDMVWTGGDWDGYGLLIGGHLKIVDEALARRLTAFVRGGGTLVLGAQSGLKDKNNHIVQRTAPGLLAELAGVEVQAWTTLADGESRAMQLEDGRTVEGISFVEKLRPVGKSARVLARWVGGDGLLGDGPAIVRQRVGKGRVLYVGAYCPTATIEALLDVLGRWVDLAPTVGAPPEVEAIERAGGKRRWLMLLNHSAGAKTVARVPQGTELLGDTPVRDGTIALPGYGVAVVEC